MQQVDARLNEWQGSLDGINGITLTDARTAVNTLASNNAEVLIDLNGKSTLFVDVRCSVTFNAATNLMVEGTIDGTNYFQLPFFFAQSNAAAFPAETVHNVLGGASVVAGGVFLLCCSVTGFRRVRVRMNFTTAGTAAVAMRATEADYRIIAQPQPTMLWIPATAAANAIATATLPAAGAGLFHYITYLHLSRNATAVLAGTATLIATTTNLPGSPAWSYGNVMVAGGYVVTLDQTFSNPLKSSVANTATTVVMPAAGAAVLNRINVGYYVGA